MIKQKQNVNEIICKNTHSLHATASFYIVFEEKENVWYDKKQQLTMKLFV